MELKSPWGLALAGLLVPLIALYILKIKRPRVTVASTWLWQQAERDLLARSPFKRLIAQLPLLLQILALLLLVFAFAAPATRGGSIAGDHLAIVIDTSASMSARTENSTRLDLAKAEALRIINGLSPGTDAIIIEASAEARTASPLDRDRRRLSKAIEQLKPSQVQGKLSPALALATDRLRSLTGTKQIVLITDGSLADPVGLASAALPLKLVEVGAPIENTAITRVDFRTGIDPITKRDQLQAFAMVAHYGSTPRSVYITLKQRNVETPIASRQLQLAPGESTPVVLTFEPTTGDRGSGLELELSPKDAFEADDRAYGRVPGNRKLPVVWSSTNPLSWVKRALEADNDIELFEAAPSGLSAANIPVDALVVMDGFCPAQLPAGHVLIHNPPSGACHHVIVGDELQSPEITSWNDSDARLRFLTLDGISIAKARRLELEGERDALVRSRDGALISDLPLIGRHGTLIGFDVGESNWPLKSSFVLFIRNIAEQARAAMARGVSGATTTGSPLRLTIPPQVSEVKVLPPSGESYALPAKSGLAIIPDVSNAGFYHISWTEEPAGSVLAVANLTSAEESDTRPKPLPELSQAGQAAAKNSEQEALTDWAWLAALLGLGFVILDVWWFTRKPRAKAPSAPKAPDRSVFEGSKRAGSALAPTPRPENFREATN